MKAAIDAFSNAIDTSYVIYCDSNTIFQQQILINMFTAFKQLFDAVEKGKHTTENGLW